MKLYNFRLKRLTFIGLGIYFGFFVWSGTCLSAQEKNKTSHLNRKAQIHIISDKMEVNSRKKLIVFIGNVEANQGNMRLKANRLEIYTLEPKPFGSKRKPTPKDRGGEIDRIVATGNVEMDQAKRRFATAARLEYRESTGIAILTGNPRVWEGKNRLVGAKIELNLKEDRTIVHSSRRQRVSVTLFPTSETPRRKKSN
ncbi:MAG: lipopolysaccharide transport periplasmic protein LptA [Nitrospinae bacterium]|nr:lipopolysaccharide transport periplasmic protein LptA [Nitrospinota bacterium]